MVIRNRQDPQKTQEQRLRYIAGRSGHPRLLQLGCAIAFAEWNGTATKSARLTSEPTRTFRIFKALTI